MRIQQQLVFLVLALLYSKSQGLLVYPSTKAGYTYHPKQRRRQAKHFSTRRSTPSLVKAAAAAAIAPDGTLSSSGSNGPFFPEDNTVTGSDAISYSDLLKSTLSILEGNSQGDIKYGNDEFSAASSMGEDYFSLMLAWARTESQQGAEMVEKLLGHLEQEEEVNQKNNYNNSRNKKRRILHGGHYTVAVDAWTKSRHEDSAKNARRILNKMKKAAEIHPGLSPTRVAYNSLMNSYVRSGEDPKKIEEILQMMENTPGLEPITKDYNALLGAYAKLGQARQADQVLKRMVDICNRLGKECNCSPDLYSYSILLDAWGNSREPGRGRRAEQLLTSLTSHYESGTFPFKPDSRIYSSAIYAVVNSGEESAIERAECLLEQAEQSRIELDAYVHSAILEAYANNPTPGYAEKAEKYLEKLIEENGSVNSVTYNIVLKAWKGREDDKALERAEALVKRMQNIGVADAFSYSTLVSFHANQATKESAERAEEILQEMQKLGVSPSTHVLNAVMNAWIQCGRVERAERILDDMEQSYHDGKREVAPNVVSYSTVMNGWAKSKALYKVQKTEEVFKRMQAMYESGVWEARPNMFSYVTLINSIVRSGAFGAAEKAEGILHQMYDLYKTGSTPDIKPNNQLVTSVIDCWQKSGVRDAGERAEQLLTWMIDVYEAEGREKAFEPNEYTFAAAISSWAKTRKFGKAARARSILQKMIEMHDSGAIQATPNAHCYSAVINSCAYSENDALEKRYALRIALDTYKELVSSSYALPSHVTYATMVAALRNLMPDSDKRTAAIGAVFKRCAEDGQVTKPLLQRLQLALGVEQLRQLVGDQAVTSDGIVEIARIPKEWKKNAKL